MPSRYNPYVTEVVNPTLGEVVRQLQSGAYSVSPTFQRPYVWKIRNQNSLIESILLGYALPTFFAFSEMENGKMMTYFSDGQQRLTTIQRFMENKFRFRTEIEVLKHLNGKRFKDFMEEDKWLIDQFTIKIERWISGTPIDIVKDHYDRINTGGIPLNLGSIRRNTLSGPYYDFLKILSNDKTFIKILGSKGTPMNLCKLEHEKFCQIWATLINNRVYHDGETYYTVNPALLDGDLDKHLGYYRDNPDKVTPEFKASLESKFRNAVDNINLVFGECAFRRLRFDNESGQIGTRKYGPFNQGIFEIMMVFFSYAKKDSVILNKEKIKELYYNEIKNNTDFFLSIARGTTTYKSAKIRFKVFHNILVRAGVIFNEM